MVTEKSAWDCELGVGGACDCAVGVMLGVSILGVGGVLGVNTPMYCSIKSYIGWPA
jgi:hypothetical protein